MAFVLQCRVAIADPLQLAVALIDIALKSVKRFHSKQVVVLGIPSCFLLRLHMWLEFRDSLHHRCKLVPPVLLLLKESLSVKVELALLFEQALTTCRETVGS